MFTGIIEAVGTVAAVERRTDGSAVLTIDAGPLIADLPTGGSLAVNGVCLTAVPSPAPATAPETPQPPRREGAKLWSGAPETAVGHPLDADDRGQEDTGARRFTADVMGETLRLTSLGGLAPGDPVNVERCLSPAGRFDGHIVQGHVDGTGTLRSITDHGSWAVYRFAVPADLAPYTALKGSIAIDGVSLTISGASAPDSGPAPDTDTTGTSTAVPGAAGASTADDAHWVEVSLIPATRAHTILGRAAPGQAVNIEVDVFAKYAERLAGFRAAGTAGAAATIPATPTTAPAAAPADSAEGALA